MESNCLNRKWNFGDWNYETTGKREDRARAYRYIYKFFHGLGSSSAAGTDAAAYRGGAPAIATGAVAHDGAGAPGRRKETAAGRDAHRQPKWGDDFIAGIADAGHTGTLENPQTDRKVDAQTVRVGQIANGGSLVPFEFSSPAPDFWAVFFPPALN